MKQTYPFKLNVNAEEYHARPEVGSSSLRTIMNQSPAHYLYKKNNPSESTAAQRLGTLIHTAILEPRLFRENSMIEPEFSGVGSRAAKEKWYLENEGRLILKRDQMTQIAGILHAISGNATASSLLSEGAAESSLFWKDSETDMALKMRPDFFHKQHVIVDVKTTTDASYKAFQHTISSYGYHIQAALYLDGASAVEGRVFDQFVIIAVEKEPPYAVNSFLLDETTIAEGRALYYSALQVLKKCVETNSFPAYVDKLTPISIPTWAFTRGDDE